MISSQGLMRLWETGKNTAEIAEVVGRPEHEIDKQLAATRAAARENERRVRRRLAVLTRQKRGFTGNDVIR